MRKRVYLYTYYSITDMYVLQIQISPHYKYKYVHMLQVPFEEFDETGTNMQQGAL